jgi:hypothetical protein
VAGLVDEGGELLHGHDICLSEFEDRGIMALALGEKYALAFVIRMLAQGASEGDRVLG